jgi:glycosyltransferase involved in cell wall biosynthesis
VSTVQPTVSIVIPCYNQGRFLAQAIDSALGQTGEAVEVLVVNDGSADETRAVAASYGGTVRLIDQANQGTAAARNHGLRESAGPFVIFLDADDRLLPGAAAIGREWLDAHPDWAFVTGHVTLVREDGSPAGVPPQHHADGDRYLELLRSNYIWTPGAVMYRRSAIEAAGGYAPWAAGSADYELNIRLARQFAFGCHHQIVLEYRQHAANMSTDAAHMLRSAVRVRRAQRRHVRGRRDAERALARGIAIVQDDFGGRLVEQVKADLREPKRWGLAIDGVQCLLRYHPRGLLQIMDAVVRARAARRR